MADTVKGMAVVVFKTEETVPDNVKLPGVIVPPEIVVAVWATVSVGAFALDVMVNVPFAFEETVKVPAPKVLLRAP